MLTHLLNLEWQRYFREVAINPRLDFLGPNPVPGNPFFFKRKRIKTPVRNPVGINPFSINQTTAPVLSVPPQSRKRVNR